MLIYLDNNQETVIEINEDDHLKVVPIRQVIGGVYKIESRNSYRADFWDGNTFTSKRIHIREYNYSFSTTKEAVTKYYNDNLILKYDTPITIKAKEITPNIIKYFRYVPRIIEYPERDVILNPYMIGIWLEMAQVI